ncbi:AI-2E family transporter [Paraburkholderia kururiensis]|uniref:AI-2E family transporter n=1 Tax=Paraburkholderia kururiensis TaxID=984307 RepID=A0ABZ0WKU1_9BURK|nr:AI-2E family transporter [Paraburkholderia kururiensis]WQD77970.1 AI-2E family transporter [Paraburkholderia kururiensis]
MNPSFPPRRENARVRPPEVPGLRTLTSMVAGVIAICALYFGRAVLMPITLAVLLSFLLAPFATALKRVGFRHVPSVIAAVLVALSVIAATGVLIGAQVAQLAGDLPRYQAAFEHKAQVLHEQTIGRADALLRRASGALNHVAPSREEEANRERSASPSDRPPMPVEVHEPTPSPLQLMQRFASPVVSPLETAGIVAVVAIFILLQREDLRDRLIRLFGARDLHRTTTAMDEAARRLSRYFLAQVAINTGVGALVCIGLAIIGVPGALLFGVVTALARFLPYVGAWIAGLLAVLLAAAVGAGWWMAVWTAILFVTVELAAGQFVEPVLYGNSTGLSPFAVIVSALFWSWIWGPVGLVLSTPLTLCLVTLGRHVERVEFLDVLFGDHPVLTPGENLYHRLLAGDAADALVQGDTVLAGRPLEAWYDEVLLDCLRLAYDDVERGVVPPEQITRVRRTAFTVMEGLASHADGAEAAAGVAASASTSAASSERGQGRPEQPGQQGRSASAAPSTSAHDVTRMPVLCVRGRGEYDGIVAVATAQLLNRRGIEATVTGADRFSRTRVDEAKLPRDTVICIATLHAREAPPWLRNLVRRVQPRATKLVLGIALPNDTEGIPDVPDLAPPTRDGNTSNQDELPRASASFTALTEACVDAARVESGSLQPEYRARNDHTELTTKPDSNTTPVATHCASR